MTERINGVTFKGTPMTVIGATLNVGDRAPDFALTAPDLSAVTLADSAGQVRLLNVVTSLDTSICDMQTRRFEQELSNYGGNLAVYTISADIPFAQKRWLAEAELAKVRVLSDYKDMSFGTAYGTYIKELRLEQRSIFVVDADNVVRYVEYVPEVAQHPDYDAALAALKKVVG
jgi:thiol peroxidase